MQSCTSRLNTRPQRAIPQSHLTHINVAQSGDQRIKREMADLNVMMSGNAEVGHHVSQIPRHPRRPRMEVELYSMSCMSSVISIIRNLAQSSGFQLLASSPRLIACFCTTPSSTPTLMNGSEDDQLYAAGIILDEEPWSKAPSPVQKLVRTLLDFTSTILPDCLLMSRFI